jgi:hypothetical protein
LGPLACIFPLGVAPNWGVIFTDASVSAIPSESSSALPIMRFDKRR